MIEMIKSLSLMSGAFVVAIISGVVSGVSCCIIQSRWKWAVTVIVPIVTAHSIYWMPVRHGADPSEYSAWSVLFIVPWALAGIIASALVCLLIGRTQRIKKKR